MNSTHPGASSLLFALLLALSIAIRPSVPTAPPFCSFHIERASVVNGRTIHTVATSSLDECIEQCRSFGVSCTGANFLLDMRGRPMCLLVDAKSPAGSADSLSPHPSTVMYAARRWCSGGGGGAVGPSTVADYKSPPSGAGVPCLNGRSTWMFERLPNMNLFGDHQFTHHLLSSQIGTSLETCLHHCLQSPACNSVLHSTGRSECRLLRISPHRVHSVGDYFGEDDEWDLYESNCERVQHSPQHCTFVRRQYIGLVDIFDVVLAGNINDWHECEQRCLDSIRLRPAKEGESASMGAICRSYTYSRQSNSCYLSHQSRMGSNMAGDTDGSLTSGELSDCQHFSLNCASNFLTLSSRSMKLFTGSVGVRKRGGSGGVACEQAVQDTYAFRVEIPFNEQECGLERDEQQALPSYSAMLIVKEGGGQRRGLVTHADKMIQVNCRMHQQVTTRLRMLSSPLTPMAIASGQRRFELEQGNFTMGRANRDDEADPTTRFPTPGTFTVPSLPLADAPSVPAYRLEVLDAAGRAADTVDMEDFGYLQISALPLGPSHPSAPAPPTDFTISELVAENLVDGRLVELIDSNGCVSNYGVVKSLERWEPNSLRVGILFSGFGNHARVTYQAMIKPCIPLHSCVQGAQECNRRLYATGKGAERQDGDANGGGDVRRTIRAIVPLDGLHSGRRIELHSDTYKVHSLAALRIGAMDEELEGQVGKEEMPSGFQRCLFDANCLLTVFSFSVQLLLCLLCIFMLYSHVIRRWRHRSPCPTRPTLLAGVGGPE